MLRLYSTITPKRIISLMGKLFSEHSLYSNHNTIEKSGKHDIMNKNFFN
jgi:hypothetical protein